MALFTPSESPAVVVKEVDLTGGVPNVQSSTGAFVGNFRWGPARKATLVSSETDLAEKFGSPNSTTNIDFLSANQYLKYSSSLYVVREVTSAAKNACADQSSLAEPTLVRDRDHYDTLTFGADSSDLQVGMFFARCPGTLGNSLSVEVVTANISSFTSWTHSSSFDRAPGTSDYVLFRGGTNDEIHVVVLDKDGEFTGTVNAVLETFPHVSLASDAKNDDGTSNYVKDVINDRSRYIFFGTFEQDVDSDGITDGTAIITNAGSTAKGTEFAAGNTAVILKPFAGGVDSGTLTPAEYGVATTGQGFDLFADKNNIQVDFLIAPGMASSSDQISVVNDMVVTAGTTRKDCVVIASPARNDIVSSATPNASAITTAGSFASSSYLIVDNNYLKVYDKFTDRFVFIPAASSTAGIMAATDNNAAPWYSPAGSRRGAYLGITSLAYNPTKAERDSLYRANVNPISNIPGQGVLLFGDKTHLLRPSAFDRINVRRLFLVLERAIELAGRNVMFEFNDEFTRAEFVNIVEPVLREVKGRRGITDFKVVCDDTNNTAAVIDRNEFIASIFIKPARSINYVTLNFVAVRTGVEFEEVVGTV